jgi:hypothetical protein
MSLLLHWSNLDFASNVIRFLPFPALGRLAKASNKLKVTITQQVIDKAMERGRKLFGKADIVLQPPYDSFYGVGFGSCVRILDLEENTLEIGRKDTTTDLVTVKWEGRRFTGTADKYKYCSLVQVLEDAVHSIEEEDLLVWFEIRGPTTLRVKFSGKHWTVRPTKDKPMVFDVRLLLDD